MDYKPCFLVPCYNHGSTMHVVLDQLSQYELTCFIVDDGSSLDTAEVLASLAGKHDWVELIRHERNLGKGGAVQTGMKKAWDRGFSHAIQIDADGQHDPNDIPKILELSKNAPQALISGQPVFDDTVPKSRLYGRCITHFWVWVETLSLQIKDSMCGYRAYPLDVCRRVIERGSLGQRMDFDVEIMVRLFWEGVQVKFFNTRVVYPETGVSHFNLIEDNVLISWMHTRLFFGMLLRLPRLITNKLRGNQYWSQTHERGCTSGIKFMLWVYKVFGRRFFNLLLYPVMTYFWLTGRQARRASQDYINQIQTYAKATGRHLDSGLTSFKHFMNFGSSILDKAAGWNGDIKLEDVDFPSEDLYRNVVDSGKGVFVIGSHLGNLELCRALGDAVGEVKVNSLVFTQNAEHFNQILKSVSPRVDFNLIQVTDMGPETAIMLQQKINKGEWIVVVADRTPVTMNNNVVSVDFLGKEALFPQGPFVLASLMKCPVYLMFGLNERDGFRVYFEPFANPLLLPRKNRQEAIKKTVQKFANRLEHYCMNAPLDWFNFFNFWNTQSGK